VVVTAPMPGVSIPSLPSAGATWTLSLLGNFGSPYVEAHNAVFSTR
jgi:hypothetical protein